MFGGLPFRSGTLRQASYASRLYPEEGIRLCPLESGTPALAPWRESMGTADQRLPSRAYGADPAHECRHVEGIRPG